MSRADEAKDRLVFRVAQELRSWRLGEESEN